MKNILQRTLSALVCLVMITTSLPAFSEMTPSATLEIVEEILSTPAPETTAQPGAETTPEPSEAPAEDLQAPSAEPSAEPSEAPAVLPEESETDMQVLTMEQALSALNGEESPFGYIITDGEASITGYTGTEEIITLPDMLEGCPVTAVAPSAFAGNTAVKEILLPAGVKNIGEYAFSGCTALERVTFAEEGELHIGAYAFSGCTALAGLLLPYQAEIGEGAFEGCTALTLEVYEGSNADTYCAAYALERSYRAAIAPTAIIPEKASYTIGLNETISLAGYTLEPAGAQAAVSYSSKSKSIAAVNADGLVIGKKAGSSTTITLKTDNGEKCTVKVSVKKAPTSIKLSAERSVIGAGETLQLKATLSSSSASYKIDCVSSDPSIATVDAKGLLTAHKPGKVSLTAATYNGKTTKTPLEIEILPAPASIFLDAEEITLGKGDSRSLSYMLSEGSTGAVTFSSSDEGIAAVDASGKIKAVSAGSAVITAETYNGLTAQCTVSVVSAPGKISLIAARKTIGAGEQIQLTTAFDNEEAAASIKFKSSKSSVVSVDANGLITAKKTGSATITATTHNNKKASVKITVKKAPTSITLIADRTVLGAGETLQLSRKLSSGAAAAVTCTVSDESVLTIDASGLLTAIAPGKADIYATTYNGKISNVIPIEILPAPENITLSAEEITIAVKDSRTLTYTLNEGSAGTVSFSSSDDAIAKVSSSGKITAGSTKGTAVITAITHNGAMARCTVTVTHAPSSISVSADRKTIGVGETLQLKTALKSEGASATLKFKSSSSSVASVDANGLVTAKKAGSATITVTTHNSKKATIKITVKKAPTSVTAVAERTILGLGEETQLAYKLSSSSAGTVRYECLTPDIASVTPEGRVFSLSTGTAQFIAVAHNGVSSEPVSVEILPAPTHIILSETSFLLGAGDSSASLHAQVNEGSTGVVSYHSENSSIAKIDALTGKITAVAPGFTRLYASTYVEGLYAWADIEVLPAPSYVSLPMSKITLGVGDTLQLQPEFDAGAHTTLSYSSKSSSYASVSADGLITAKAAGETTITVTTHNGVSCKLTVTVKKAPTSISANPAQITLGVGETAALGYKLTSGSAATVRAESLNSAVAAIDENGLVTAKSVGTAEIQLTTHNGKSCTCIVTVQPAPKKIIFSAPKELGVKLSAASSVTLQPDNASSTITYSVVSQKTAQGAADASIPVVQIDANGVITGLNPGTATLRASTYLDGVYADQTITVLPAPTKVAFAQSEYTVLVGETLQLMPLINDGSLTQFTYKAAKKDFFTIDENGLITPRMRGVTTVTVTTHNGLTASCTITVMDPFYPEDIYLAEATPEYMESNDTYIPVVATVPETAIPAIVWSTSDAEIVDVDEDTGEITAVSYGQATITGQSTRNPSLKISYKVTVLNNKLCLTMPKARTNTSRISKTLSEIRAVRSSAYQELDRLYSKGVITKADRDKRKASIERAFEMNLFPWMTDTKELYWKAANSEDGAKDFKPGIVYYGLPYTQTSRNYNVDKALAKGFFTSTSKGYYKLQGEKFTSRYYPGNDCSSFVSMAIHGTNSDYSYQNTRAIASTNIYRTLSNWEDLRPGDLLNKGGSHVVMFLYYANEAKTQMVIIEQGGSVSADRGIDNLAYSNTVACSIKNVSYYTSRSYKIRRLASLGY